MVFKLFAILQKYDFSSKSQLLLFHSIVLLSCLRYCKSTIFQANHNPLLKLRPLILLFAILQKYDFSSKSQHKDLTEMVRNSCLRYCKSTIFQANHNRLDPFVAKLQLFAILQKYDFSSKSQLTSHCFNVPPCCLRYCKSTIFQANHNTNFPTQSPIWLFAILQKYDFSSKSQQLVRSAIMPPRCLRYCKSTIFQANHNSLSWRAHAACVVCDTAKVRFFKQITTNGNRQPRFRRLFAILQKYDFSSKSQLPIYPNWHRSCCLRYCKSTIFQANHNPSAHGASIWAVVCDTAKVRFFKQITTVSSLEYPRATLFAILQKYDFSSKSQLYKMLSET